MTKRDLVIRISNETGLVQQQVLEVVQKTLDYIAEAVAQGKKVELRNFGVFEVKARAARKARNPRTGQRVDVPEKFVVTFKPGKEMEEKVRELEQRLASQGISLSSDQNNRPAAPPASPDTLPADPSPSPALE
jgi:nucleoid DNA-binding protein